MSDVPPADSSTSCAPWSQPLTITGIDIAEPAVDLARQHYPEARFEVTDGEVILFDDGTFDLVYCTGVLVVEPRYQEVWKEMPSLPTSRPLID